MTATITDETIRRYVENDRPELYDHVADVISYAHEIDATREQLDAVCDTVATRVGVRYMG